MKNELTNLIEQDVVVKPCLTINFFFKYTKLKNTKIPEALEASIKEQAYYNKMIPVTEIYDDYLELLREFNLPQFNFMANPQTKKWIDLAKQPDLYLPFPIYIHAIDGRQWFAHYHSAENANDAADIFFSGAGGSPNSQDLAYISLGFPVDLIQDDKKLNYLIDKIKYWVNSLQPEHGYVAIEMMRHNSHANRAVVLEHNYCQQYKGLGLHYPQHIIYQIKDQDAFYGIQWLTFLHEKYIELLPDNVKNILENSKNTLEKIGVFSEKLGDLYFMQLAKKPELTAIPDSYQKLAQLLEPLRYTKLKTPHPSNFGFTDSHQYQQWLARFLEV